MKECENCSYYGRPSDAPETTEKDCMYTPTEEDMECTPPCQREWMKWQQLKRDLTRYRAEDSEISKDNRTEIPDR